MADLKEIADSLIKGKAPQVKELVKKAHLIGLSALLTTLNPLLSVTRRIL